MRLIYESYNAYNRIARRFLYTHVNTGDWYKVVPLDSIIYDMECS